MGPAQSEPPKLSRLRNTTSVELQIRAVSFVFPFWKINYLYFTLLGMKLSVIAFYVTITCHQSWARDNSVATMWPMTMLSGHKVVFKFHFTIFIVDTSSRHWGLTIFRFFLVPEAILRCHVVAKLKQFRLPSSARHIKSLTICFILGDEAWRCRTAFPSPPQVPAMDDEEREAPLAENRLKTVLSIADLHSSGQNTANSNQTKLVLRLWEKTECGGRYAAAYIRSMHVIVFPVPGIPNFVRILPSQQYPLCISVGERALILSGSGSPKFCWSQLRHQV